MHSLWVVLVISASPCPSTQVAGCPRFQPTGRVCTIRGVSWPSRKCQSRSLAWASSSALTASRTQA